MANKTLLNGVNEVFKKLRLIQGDAGSLSTLTDSSRQNYIDMTIQAWNEAIDEVYHLSDKPLPNQHAEATITLVTSTRDYTLATNYTRLHWPLHDETNGYFITEYPGGYLQMRQDLTFPSNETGLPQRGAIDPTDGSLYLDKLPTANENGLVFTYHYSKDLELTSASDTFPFDNAVFRAMVPAVSEIVNRIRGAEYSIREMEKQLGRAAGLLRKTPHDGSYLNIHRHVTSTDPFDG